MMKHYLIIALLFQVLLGCSTDISNYGYDYVKVMTLRDVDSGNAYNKGQGLWNYFYYNPKNDSVILREVQLPSDEPYTFITYAGQFKEQHYADTIAMLIAFLKRYKEGDLSYENLVHDNSNYCGSNFFAEYSIDGQPKFISFIVVGNDTLNRFDHFFYWLQEEAKWDRKIIPNSRIDETEETIHMLKGLGWYDSIIYTPPYIPLPCEKGIKTELLYGKWRTSGYIYGNGKQVYTTVTIKKDGSLIIEDFRDGKIKPIYSAKIVSLNSNHTIKLVYKDTTPTLKILNLTENCLEYIPEGANSNQTWQLYRMKQN
jgi:hypothetical protein